jgi:hypothetical protein
MRTPGKEPQVDIVLRGSEIWCAGCDLYSPGHPRSGYVTSAAYPSGWQQMQAHAARHEAPAAVMAWLAGGGG